VKAGLFRPLTLWPFPEAGLKLAAKSVERVFVPEMNWGQVVREVERILHRDVVPITQVDGEGMRPQSIIDGVRGKAGMNS